MMAPRTTYREALMGLNREVAAMGSLAHDMVDKGMQAFLQGDAAVREEVAAMDREVYRQEQEIEQHCFEIIALYQPVASDLRTVSSCLKVVTDLSRIGRYGRNIAELGGGLDHSVSRLFPLPLMAQRVISMVKDAIASFVKLDQGAALALFDRDDEVDALWESTFRCSLCFMVERSQNISDGAYAMLAARYLERIADHACNIGERVVFIVSGTRMDHYARKRTPRLDFTEGPAQEPSTDGYYVTRLDEK